jgi:hypothetical protein
MNAADFEEHALALIASGFSPLPIAPGEKYPGGLGAGGAPYKMTGWDKWCREQPNEATMASWLRMIGNHETGLGVACGLGLICIDIDLEEAVDPLLAILPASPVQKKGRKGISLFYRGDTEKIRSKNFRTPERVGLVDLLAEGKQTVLPPSIHPDTGEPYYWWTDETLADYRPEELPELPEDIAEQIGEVLRQFGYDPEGDRRIPVQDGAPGKTGTDALAGDSDVAAMFRKVNDAALVNLSAWVPRLGLQRLYRAGRGFKAVAEWRSSGSGRPFHLRAPNLSFTSLGIRDFGDGRGYSGVDVVMEAQRVSAFDALEWLAPLVGVQIHDPKAAALAERLVASAGRKKECV